MGTQVEMDLYSTVSWQAFAGSAHPLAHPAALTFIVAITQRVTHNGTLLTVMNLILYAVRQPVR
jgi:hypothetical protein